MSSFRKTGYAPLSRGQAVIVITALCGLLVLPAACTLVKPDHHLVGLNDYTPYPAPEPLVLESESDREPAAARRNTDKEMATALYSMMKIIEQDARAQGKSSVVQQGGLIWGAVRAFNKGDGHGGRTLLNKFLDINANSTYLKLAFSKSAHLQAKHAAILDHFNLRYQGTRYLRMAKKATYLYQQRLENAWNHLNPATQKNTGLVNMARYAYSNRYGYNRTAGEAKRRIDRAVNDLRNHLISSHASKSLDFMRDFRGFSNVMEGAVNALSSGYGSITQHARLVELSVAHFKRAGRFFTLKNPATAGNLAQELIELRRHIFKLEGSEARSRIYWEAGKLSATITGLYLTAIGSGVALFVPGLQAPAAGSLAGSLIAISTITGTAFAAAGGVGAADHLSRVGQDNLTAEDWKQFGMNAAMMVGLGGVRLANSPIAATLRATRAGRNALAASNYASTTANVYLAFDQSYMAVYMLTNAKAIAEQTGQSLYEVRLQGFMNALLAVTGGIEAARMGIHQVRNNPNDFKFVWKKYDGIADVAHRPPVVAHHASEASHPRVEESVAKRVVEEAEPRLVVEDSQGVVEFSNLVDNFQRTGKNQEVIKTLDLLGDFENGFLNNRSNQSYANADRYITDFVSKSQTLLKEGRALRQSAEKMSGERKLATLADAREKIQAGRLFENAIQAARYVKKNIPLYDRMDRVAERASKADDALDAAARLADDAPSAAAAADGVDAVIAHQTEVVNQYNLAKREIEGAISETTVILKALNDARRSHSPEYTKMKDVLKDLQDYTRLASTKIYEQQQVLTGLHRTKAAAAETALAASRAKASDEAASRAKVSEEAAARARLKGDENSSHVDLGRSPAREGLTPEQLRRLDTLLTEPTQRESLETLVSRKMSEARSKGITEEAFNRRLAESLNSCLKR